MIRNENAPTPHADLAIPRAFTHNPRERLAGFMEEIVLEGFGGMSLFRNVSLGAALALSLLILPRVGHAYTPEQQQACQPDAMRLCGAFVPDVDRITACMIQNKSQLSPECQKYFRAGPEPAAAAPADDPMNITPAPTRKTKSKTKAKKTAKPDAT